MNLAKWNCHKVVSAGKILAATQLENGTVVLTVEQADGTPATVPCAPKMLARTEPEVGWYYVVYASGYASFSPADEFEAGYTRAA